MATKQKSAKETVEDVFAGRSVGELLVEAFTNLVADAKSGEIANSAPVAEAKTASDFVLFCPRLSRINSFNSLKLGW